MSKDKMVNGYYQTNITTSRGENITYTTEYAIDKLQQKIEQLKERYRIRSEAYNKVLLENASLKDKVDLYKEVVEEVRETLINSKEYKMANAMNLNAKQSVLVELLQILDKVKGE